MAPCFATSSVTTELVLVMSSAALGGERRGEEGAHCPLSPGAWGQSARSPAAAARVLSLRPFVRTCTPASIIPGGMQEHRNLSKCYEYFLNFTKTAPD